MYEWYMDKYAETNDPTYLEMANNYKARVTEQDEDKISKFLEPED